MVNMHDVLDSVVLSQAALARELGVHPNIVSRWRHGTEPTFESRYRLAALLRKRAQRMLTEADEIDPT
jgi:transcriptional regulator with XRE-family HTH domain